jgi:hypothetical protein
MQNARSVSEVYRELEPLYSMRTGDIIANFPVSLDDLDHLQGTYMHRREMAVRAGAVANIANAIVSPSRLRSGRHPA